jgi:hypothetical protein
LFFNRNFEIKSKSKTKTKTNFKANFKTKTNTQMTTTNLNYIFGKENRKTIVICRMQVNINNFEGKFKILIFIQVLFVEIDCMHTQINEINLRKKKI